MEVAVDIFSFSLLLDNRQGLPLASMGQCIPSLAAGNIFWRRHARAWPLSILQPPVARAGAFPAFPEVGSGTASGPNSTQRLMVICSRCILGNGKLG